MELQHEKEDEWTECFKVPNVKLPDQVYLGFTAHTGEISGTNQSIENRKKERILIFWPVKTDFISSQ
jgi:mannose-binding lectin 2